MEFQRLKDEEQTIRDFVKDPYVLEFLELPENKSLKESSLEQSIINNLQEFLLEFGKGFSFVGRQFRISTETSHCYIDLVFYNYLIKCFVIIDLKTNKLTHQDIGQMDMYVRMFDDLKRVKTITPPSGLFSAKTRRKPLSDTLFLKRVSNSLHQNIALYFPQKKNWQRNWIGKYE